MRDRNNVAIVGGGLNGLVTAAYLAREGRSVVVLEKADQVGGTAATIEIAPGFRGPAAIDSFERFHPSIVEDLELEKHGLRLHHRGGLLLLREKRDALYLGDDFDLASQVGDRDASAFVELKAFLNRIGKALDPILTGALPPLPPGGIGGLRDHLRLGLNLRRLGKRDLPEALRFLPMNVKDVLDERFKDDSLKAALAGSALRGMWMAPRSAGSAYGLLHNNPPWAGGLVPTTKFAVATPLPPLRGVEDAYAHPSAAALYAAPSRGDEIESPFEGGARGTRAGDVGLAGALASAAQAAGVEIQTNATVERILVDRGQTSGVVLSDGTEIEAKAIISALDPRQTFLELTRTDLLSPDFVEAVTQIRSRGGVSIIRLALDRLPDFAGASKEQLRGRIQIGETMDTLERAFDAAKFGEAPEEPFLTITIPSLADPSLAPDGKHVMIVWAQFTPPRIRDRDWSDEREALGDRVVDLIERHAPGFSASILHRQIDTPADLEERFGITGGCLDHAELALDQLLYMRPIPGWFKHQTPIDGLYLCGPGTHPGGAGTGLSGKCAASRIISDWRR